MTTGQDLSKKIYLWKFKYKNEEFIVYAKSLTDAIYRFKQRLPKRAIYTVDKNGTRLKTKVRYLGGSMIKRVRG